MTRPSRRRRRPRGFTLVELMVALLMGLLVALAAVGLAKTATTTFFEQARISGVEANVRAASERLRNDLSRIAYMSTPNINWDPRIATAPQVAGTNYRVKDLVDLQGIQILHSPIRSNALTLKNNLTPQDVLISGNLTSDDVYRGQYIADSAPCGSGGGAQIRLNSLADPAVRRLFNGATDNAQIVQMVELAFMPGEVMVPAAPGFSYPVQVMDMRGCFHYLTICGVTSTTANEVTLQLSGDAARGLLSATDTGGGLCGASIMEEVAIAPIQRVQWQLRADTNAQRLDSVIDTAGSKINLERQLLDASGTKTIGNPEVIAEYAIDLRLGFMVDPSPDPPNPTNIGFEADDELFEKTWAGPASKTLAGKGPQRIRSVRYRLAFRTPQADRTTDLLSPAGPPYLVRYCTTSADPCTAYARVRTVISEVTLLNQVKATY